MVHEKKWTLYTTDSRQPKCMTEWKRWKHTPQIIIFVGFHFLKREHSYYYYYYYWSIIIVIKESLKITFAKQKKIHSNDHPIRKNFTSILYMSKYVAPHGLWWYSDRQNVCSTLISEYFLLYRICVLWWTTMAFLPKIPIHTVSLYIWNILNRNIFIYIWDSCRCIPATIDDTLTQNVFGRNGRLTQNAGVKKPKNSA